MNHETILDKAGVRPTAVRLLVMRALDRADAPISGMDIETMLDSVDRSSITRALAVFASHGVVHSVDDGSGSVKYELCHGHHTEEHSDEHPHFHCVKCGATICLDNEPVPHVKLPEGYTAHTVNFVIKGVCAACANKDPE